MKAQINRWILAVLMALTGLVLGGCKAETEERTGEYALPAGLQDCQVYRMTSGANGSFLYVVRCPNSATSTTFRSGKTNQTAVVIDGVTYAPVSASSVSP